MVKLKRESAWTKLHLLWFPLVTEFDYFCCQRNCFPGSGKPRWLKEGRAEIPPATAGSNPLPTLCIGGLGTVLGELEPPRLHYKLGVVGVGGTSHDALRDDSVACQGRTS
jgi:hypothetical protein